MIAVGVDTHKDRHYAVALDHLGALLAEIVIDVCATGYSELESWAQGLAVDGQRLVFGIEGAGSWGAGLCEHLQRAGCMVLEVERPRRRDRRKGKSDRIDALTAAKRVLAGEGTSRHASAVFAGARSIAPRSTLDRLRAHTTTEPDPSVARDRTRRAAGAHPSGQRSTARAAPEDNPCAS